MPAHTKKHPTEAIEIRFIGPITNRARAIENLKDLGFVALTDSIHWREAFPEYGSDDSPAICCACENKRRAYPDRIGKPYKYSPAAYFHDGE